MATPASPPTRPVTTLLLDSITGPGDVRRLPAARLEQLAAQIRAFLIESVTATGGHLGPNLGVVELTIALHRVFDVETGDALLFDTGHQAYVHKLLTGRRKEFVGLRQAGGMSGYPSRSESPFDWVENSHASTALSYADGLAKARHLAGDPAAVVAVVGDGALTGGLAFEALNNLGAAERPVMVVVNDNGRSYAPTTGALAAHLELLRKGDSAMRRRNIFTDLGFAYFGPVDGHDVHRVEEILRRAQALEQPVVVHTVTVKGKGHRPAENDEADRLHAVGPASPPQVPDQGKPAQSWTSVFSKTLLKLGDERENVVALTAAMGGPTGLATFADAFPSRFFDVGIAEQHAVTSAAGMAMGGLHPVVAIYATFLNRAFDQLLLDVALHKLPVTFVLDRAGITGPDGPSHHGMWDPALLTAVPGLRLAVPRDPAQLRQLLREAVDDESGPTVVRFPKGEAGPDLAAIRRDGTADVLFASGIRDVLLVAYGPLAAECLAAGKALDAQGIGCTVADPRWAAPVAAELVQMAARHRLVVTVEDGLRSHGAGSLLVHALRESAVTTPVHCLGLPTAFIAHGGRARILAQAGLAATQITYAVLRARAGKMPAPLPARP
ncbi:1-deoxy-D-xylulose-5-phosphate synthase [Streptomyces wuyuanensis]|uniref:1-deoxy-D-xylulose-5-phosphate synthase n=1 Tax=Streptomyces wuyuanensis TaxID=1196353 RepID=UPI00342DF913